MSTRLTRRCRICGKRESLEDSRYCAHCSGAVGEHTVHIRPNPVMRVVDPVKGVARLYRGIGDFVTSKRSHA